jgi:hypothetical protein
MALPKVKHSIHEFKIPSTSKKQTFRQFLVREEKILLMAKSSEDSADIFRAMKQIVNNCCMDDSFDIDKLSVFDLEYLFLKLRSISVSNIVKVSYRDNDDERIYDFEIDLDKIEVEFPENVEKVIKITDSMGIVMKWPAASIFDDKDYFKTNSAYYELILRCIDKIYDGEDIYEASDYSNKDVEEFLDDCNVATLEKIQAFMSNTPRLYHKLEYKNSNGKDRVIELTSLTDFFTLG